MENPKISIRGIVAQSSLDDRQKMLWDKFIETLQDEHAQVIYECIANEPKNLHFLNANLEQKLDALKDMDKNKWQQIIQDEKEHLDKLEKQ